MAQKLLSPLKQIPYQVQHFPIVKKAYDARYGKLRSEMYGSHLSAIFGFPENPSTIAFDPSLQLFAIGTSNGEIRIFGAPGVAFIAHHNDSAHIWRMVFIPDEARLISITRDNVLHLWEYNESESWETAWSLIKSIRVPDGPGYHITAVALSQSATFLYIGTQCGTILKLKLMEWCFEEFEYTTSRLVSVMEIQQASSLKFGAVVDLQPNPASNRAILISYESGLALVGDISDWELVKVTHLLSWQQQLVTSCWLCDGSEILTGFTDGSFMVWPIGHGDGDFVKNQEPPTTPYGPLPCKAITKIMLKSSNDGIFTLFSGGMPCSTHADKHTVSIMRDHVHVCLDLGAPLVDFLTIGPTPSPSNGSAAPHPQTPGLDNPCLLLILTELELVCLDLTVDGWPRIQPPYLTGFDHNNITAIGHASNVPLDLVKQLYALHDPNSSSHDWPIRGGIDYRRRSSSANYNQLFSLPAGPNGNVGESACKLEGGETGFSDVLLTGSATGEVCLWAIGYGSTIRRIAAVDTSQLYQRVVEQPDPDEKIYRDYREWPPFRELHPSKTSVDDIRFALTNLDLLVGSAPEGIDEAGQEGLQQCLYLLTGSAVGVGCLWSISRIPAVLDLRSLSTDAALGSEMDNVQWKGPTSSYISETSVFFSVGLHPTLLVQLEPSVPITCMCLHSAWSLLAVGCSQGFVLLEVATRKLCYQHSTLPSIYSTGYIDEFGGDGLNSLAHSVSQPVIHSRTRQLKHSISQSFRRLARLRSPSGSRSDLKTSVSAHEALERRQEEAARTRLLGDPDVASSGSPMGDEDRITKLSSDIPSCSPSSLPSPLIVAPCSSSMGRICCLLFADTYPLKSPSPSLPNHKLACLLVGTQGGTVLLYTLHLEPTPSPPTEPPPPVESKENGTEVDPVYHVKVTLCKELQLKHRSPIVGLVLIDAKRHMPPPSCQEPMPTPPPRVPQPSTDEIPASLDATSIDVVSDSLNTNTPASPISKLNHTSKTNNAHSTPIATKPATPTSSPSSPLKSASSKTRLDEVPLVHFPSCVGEHHDLIVCSQDQVKIFSLPSLTPKYKFRVHTPTQHPTPAVHTTLVNGNSEHSQSPDLSLDRSSLGRHLPGSSSQMISRKIQSFNIQRFVHPTRLTHQEYNVVLAFTDGSSTLLSIPHLRRQAVSLPSAASSPLISHVCSGDSGLVLQRPLQSSSKPLFVTALEMGRPPPTTTSGITWERYGPRSGIPLAEGLRTANMSALAKAALAAQLQARSAQEEASRAAERAAERERQATKSAINEAVSRLNAMTYEDSIFTDRGTHIGDITMDSIKEYIIASNEGRVTVKTYESRSERRTMVQEGRVTTLTHEREEIDGRITKEDISRKVGGEIPGLPLQVVHDEENTAEYD